MLFLFVSLSAYAFSLPIPTLGKGIPWQPIREQQTLSDDYRMGSEWGKIPVPWAKLNEKSAIYQRVAKATARVGGATGFYLGYFDGAHVMATNNHVYSRPSSCGSVTFVGLNNKNFQCDVFLGTWTGVDLALFTIKVTDASDDALLRSLEQPFSFDKPIYPGQKLLTIGFGVGSNPSRQMVANEDSDCVVTSLENEFRFMADPDRYNPGPHKTWSFSNACDVSHGDSGSAMVDRETGDVIGLIWTGNIPKSSRVKNSNYIQSLIGTNHSDIWTELSYAVPAAKIKEQLTAAVQTTTNPRIKSILTAIIER